MTTKWPEPKDDLEKYEPQQIDRGHNWLPVPIIGLDTDYGLTIGGGVKLLTVITFGQFLRNIVSN